MDGALFILALSGPSFLPFSHLEGAASEILFFCLLEEL